MLITFHNATLADLTASPQVRMRFEKPPGSQCVLQKTPLYNAPFPFLAGRGNASGQTVFVTSCSFGSFAAACAAIATGASLVGIRDTLAIAAQGGIAGALQMPNAVLLDVQPVELHSLWLKLRYTFEITAINSGLTADSTTATADDSGTTADSQ